VLLVAVLTVRTSELPRFRAFEHAAARVMLRHGGAIEHAYTFDHNETSFRELHVVRFPDEAAFAAYRRDPELATLAVERERSVISAELWPAGEIRY
jgi:hypothetical protein